MPESEQSADRNRGSTEQRLIAAALALLTQEGSAALGINAVARRAGCDKQLIYRYFGGLDGLLKAMGGDLAARMTEAFAAHLDPRPATYAAFARSMLRGLVAAYRADPLLVRIKAWEWSEPASDGLNALLRARGSAIAAFVAQTRPNFPPPPGLDVPAINALLVGAAEAAILAAASTGNLSGMPIAGEADWHRVATALGQMVTAIYGAD